MNRRDSNNKNNGKRSRKELHRPVTASKVNQKKAAVVTQNSLCRDFIKIARDHIFVDGEKAMTTTSAEYISRVRIANVF